jgi:hypothetical protein
MPNGMHPNAGPSISLYLFRNDELEIGELVRLVQVFSLCVCWWIHPSPISQIEHASVPFHWVILSMEGRRSAEIKPMDVNMWESIGGI